MPDPLSPPIHYPGSWGDLALYFGPWAVMIVTLIVLVALALRADILRNRDEEEHARQVEARAARAARRRELRKIPGGIREARAEVEAATAAIQVVVIPDPPTVIES